MRSRALILVFALLGLALLGAARAEAEDVTYTATQTIPVPPASNFAGSGGGDGWAVALSSTEVFNVFHHNSILTMACHKQVDASECYSPRTITDGGHNFRTNGHPEMHLDQSTGRLYVYATRDDSTAGVVCVDTTQAASNPNPFCGFTPLTAVGEATSAISVAVHAGRRWFSYNFVNGSGVSGTKNTLMCFDVVDKNPCPGQPFSVDIGSGTVAVDTFGEPAIANINGRIIIPIGISGVSNGRLACFDTTTDGSCSGAFPFTPGVAYVDGAGSPFPTLTSSGDVTGFCLPVTSLPCYDMSGNSATTPSGMSGAIAQNSEWNGPAVVIGPRVYLANGNDNRVYCFSYASNAACANFPKQMVNSSLLYSVNPDPQRPTCLWTNADGGSAQIQSFDAFTAQNCGAGSTRVLASQFVVARKKCEPTRYDSLQILDPPRSSYGNGTIQFADADGNPIPNTSERAIDASGTVDLSNLTLNTVTGLPQFLINLDSGSSSPTQVVVKLTWRGLRDVECGSPVDTQSFVATPTTAASQTPARAAVRCASQRRFRIRVRSRKRNPARKAKITVNGDPVDVVRRRGPSGRKRLTALIDLRGMEDADGVVVVRITATLKSGKKRKGTRRYKICAGRERGGVPKL